MKSDMDETTSSTTMDKNRIIPADIALSDDVLEKLYQRYSIKQKRAGLGCFLVASVLFDLWAICIPQRQSWESFGVSCGFLLLNISLGLFLHICRNSRYRGVVWEVAPHVAWLLAIIQLFLQLFLKTLVTPSDSLGWAILLNFLVYVTLPVPLKYAGIVFGIGSFTIYVNTIIGLSLREPFFWEQQIANILLLLTAATIGLLYYFLGEVKQRRAFLEAKQSLEVKMVIEEQSAEQERLLLSVLPEHVAVKMRQDLGSNDSEQFKKIYMSRHENVSILYADIVGFTAISSTYSAQDLVKMLNELFARFDRLAEKYHQLRIKILGDCYYCISGAPVERPDHAVLCVHMGLSMVKAIKYVQQKTNSPVDMRVGIHTGAVLAGILGQRQWQFDVYSKDVELANKMESSGMAGRVHISEKTLSFLNGEFEVEPAFGEKREESLRIAGLKTYFIKSVLRPYVDTTINEHKNGTTKIETIEPDGPSEIFKDDDSKCATVDDNDSNIKSLDKEEVFQQRLRKELVSRDGHGELSKDTNRFLNFTNKDLEQAYAKYREPLSSIPMVALLLVHTVGCIYSYVILPSSLLYFLITLSPLILIGPVVLLTTAENFSKFFSDKLMKVSKSFNDLVWLRKFAAFLIIFLVGCSNLLHMFTCSRILPRTTTGSTATNDGIYQPEHSSSFNYSLMYSIEQYTSTVCLLYPSYYSHYAVLILIAMSLIVHLSHLCKIFLMILIAGLHCLINIPLMDGDWNWSNIPISKSISPSGILIAVAVALGFLARHMDKEDRVIFIWKNEVSEQKERASDMRRRNEALVYNILPIHVAEHFMKNKLRSYDELYSQSYEEVGVLFASMPNFSDFYSEDTVNNQGLECLRFLNEVISDFDALLEVPPFQNVIKIKTISSTYMAASGLNPTRVYKPNDPVTVRWEHLAILVDFALELKKTLQCINEQSFNHFVLKMGINNGPITAGVIGARKPHYDIWGNTVNVASRMESTGKAGAIQVTEETCGILQQFGYTFEQRGLVAVKGKGQLMTYYLQGKSTLISNTTNPTNGSKLKVENINETKLGPLSPTLRDTTKSIVPSISSNSTTTSPSSVRINQNYIQSDVKQQTHTDTVNIDNENTIEIDIIPSSNHTTIDKRATIETVTTTFSTIDNNVVQLDGGPVVEPPALPMNINNLSSNAGIGPQTKNEILIENNCYQNDTDDCLDPISEKDLLEDVCEPLLDPKNSTNSNTKDYSNISERDALIG